LEEQYFPPSFFFIFISFYPQLLREAQRAREWYLFWLQHKIILSPRNRGNLGLWAAIL